MIRIRSKRPEGFRRCGIFHPSQWTEHPEGTFAEAQLAVLQAEPMLEVEYVGEPSERSEDPMGDRDGPAQTIGKKSRKKATAE